VGTAADVVRQVYAAMDRGDTGAVMALFHPEAEWDMSRSGIPGGSLCHGHEEMLGEWRRWRGAWDSYEVEVEDVLEQGERVVALLHVRARSRGAGVDIDSRSADVFTVRDGLIVTYAGFFDREDARREAGF
jgi:ketosteroid isomerase-like protein